MSHRCRLVTAATALLGALVATAGCGLVLPDDDPSAPPTSSSPAGPTERPTALPTDIRECTDDKGGVGSRVPSLAGWDVPSPAGFVESANDYSQFAPIEGDLMARYFDLDPTGFPDVIGLAYYPQLEQGLVTDACDRLIEEAVLERIALQLAEAGETVMEEPVPVEIAGAAAYEVLASSEPGHIIRNYFVYGAGELLHIECQWVEQEAAVAQGCAEVLATLSW